VRRIFCILRAFRIFKAAQGLQVCCSVLQCVAVCCSVLQCAIVCCSASHFPHSPRLSHFQGRTGAAGVMQCVVVGWLQCVAVCCSELFAVYCSVLQCVAVCRIFRILRALFSGPHRSCRCVAVGNTHCNTHTATHTLQHGNLVRSLLRSLDSR